MVSHLVLLGVFYVFILAFVTYALLCGDKDCSDWGFIGKIHYFITRGMFIGLQNGCRKLLGEKVFKTGNKAVDYCCYKPNPVLQFVYLILVLGGYVMFVKDAFPHLPGPFISGIHRWSAHICVTGTIFIFALCSMVDPGRVTKKTAHIYKDSFHYDNMLYSKKQCKTCQVEKPARSKHCSFCNVCVSRFDHHCPWVNNCIGENNLRYFLAFLFSTAFLCMYCCWVAFYILLGIVDSKGLLKIQYKDPDTGIVGGIPWAYILQYVIVSGGTVFPLGLFCGIISLVLYAFLGYHCWLIFWNTTTNESFKWYDYERYAKYYVRKLKEKEAKKSKDNDPKNPGKSKNTKDSKVDTPKNGKKGNQKEGNKKEKRFKDLSRPFYTLDKKGRVQVENTYNKGIFGNFGEVLFPRSHRNKKKKS